MTIYKDNLPGSSVIYKVLKERQMEIKGDPVLVLETLSITTSYDKAMEVLLEDPACLLVRHPLRRKEKTSV